MSFIVKHEDFCLGIHISWTQGIKGQAIILKFVRCTHRIFLPFWYLFYYKSSVSQNEHINCIHHFRCGNYYDPAGHVFIWNTICFFFKQFSRLMHIFFTKTSVYVHIVHSVSLTSFVFLNSNIFDFRSLLKTGAFCLIWRHFE